MMLAKIYVGSVVRLCSLISVCVILASCLDGSDSSFTSDIFDLGGVDSSDSDDTSSDASGVPSLSSIGVGQGTHGIGAAVTLTFVAEDAATDLSLKSGSSFNSQQLSDFAAIADQPGSYTAVYTVISGDPDVAASSAASASIVLVDADGEESAETTSVALDANTSIDANAPAIAELSVAAGTYRVGDSVPTTIIAADAETGLSLAAGSTFNGRALSGFSSNNDGSYTAIYTVVEGDPNIADGTTASVDIALADAAGNTSAAEATLLLSGARIDANSPTISSLLLAGDNVVNSSDDLSEILVSGTTVGVEAAQQVNLFIGDNITTSAEVSADGSFLATVDLAALADGTYAVTADVADSAGNPAQLTSSLTIDTVVPSIDSFAIAGDNQVNATEAASPVSATGVVSGVEVGEQVSLYVEETMLSEPILVLSPVDADGAFTAAIDLSALADATYTIVVDAYDLAGNRDRLITSLLIDTDAPSITITSVAGDNIVNAAEVAAVEVIGSTSGVEDDQSLTLSIGGVEASATTTNNAFATTIDLSALTDGTYSASASLTDAVGNSASASISNIVQDTVAPSLTIISVASDNVIDGTEAAAVAIVGTTSGAEDEQPVTITITDGTTTVEASTTIANNAFSLEVDLSTLADSTSIAASAATTDLAGNPTSTTVTNIVKDTGVPAIAITSVAGDNIVNAAEASAAAIVGATSNIENGQTVSLSITDGTTTVEASITISNNAFSTTVDLAALVDSTNLEATAATTDRAGNPISTTVTNIVKDTVVPAIAIISVAGDNIVNAAEASAAAIVGTTTNIENGQTVSLSITDGTTTVEASTTVSDNAFSLEVDLSSLADSATISASANVADVAGNPATPASIGAIVKDTVAPSLELSSVAGDNVINSAEAAAVIIVGTSVGAEADQPLSITITDGTTIIQATTGISNNAFSTEVNLSTLADSTSISVDAEVADLAGNSAAPASIGNIVKDTAAPSVELTSIATDNIINAAEAAAVAILGRTTGVENGQPVSLSLSIGTTTLETSASVSDNTFAASFDLTALVDSASIVVSADVADGAGNAAPQARLDAIVKDTEAPVISSVVVAEDDVISAAEVEAVAIVGATIGVEADQQVALNIGGLAFTAAVDSSGAFSLEANLSGLADSASLALSADLADLAGNPAAQFAKSLSKDTEAPSITSLFVSEDNVVNDTDDLAAVVVAGSTEGVEADQNVTITIDTEAPISATAAVDASGAFTTSIDLSSLSNGTYDLNASVADTAGNSADPATASFVVDIEPPTQAVIAGSIALSVDTGVSASDFITNRAQQSISAELNASLEDGEALYGSVDSGGTWSLVYSAAELSAATSFTWNANLVEGANSIQFRVADTYDNNGSLSEQNYSLDTEPPEQSIGSIALGNDTGTSASDFLTSIASQSISAILEPGLEDGDRLFGSVDSGSTWLDISDSISDTNNIVWQNAELLIGTYDLGLRITDAADNNSSFYQQYTLDQTAPTVVASNLTVAEASTASLDSSASSDANGIDSHSWQQVESDGSALRGDALAIANADTDSVQITTPAITDDSVGALSYYFAVTVTDNAGNSATSSPIALTVDNIYLTPEITATTPFLDIESSGANYFDHVGIAWSADSSLSYYLYRSTEADCVIENYSSCADDALYISGSDFSIDNSSASLIDGNRAANTTYYYWLEANVDGVDDPLFSSSAPIAATTSGPVLNDTGVTAGGDYPLDFDQHNGVGNTCDGGYLIDDQGAVIVDPDSHTGNTTFVAFADEDCEIGRDANSSLNDDSDGNAAFVFTRLNSDGSEYSGSGDYSVEPWACVLDNVTGLIWDVKTTDGTWRNVNSIFTWYNPDHGQTDADGNPITFYGTESDADTQDFVDYVNGQISVNGAYVNGSLGSGLCGLTNWRLPTVHEIQGLTDFDVIPDLVTDEFGAVIAYEPPAIDTNYFPYALNSPYQWYWTSHLNVNPDVNIGGGSSTSNYFAWAYGSAEARTRSGTAGVVVGDTARGNYVRLVSSSAAVESHFSDYSDNRYTDNGDGTISDAQTGLMWMQCSYGQTYDGGDTNGDGFICEGNPNFGTWQQAFSWAEDSNTDVDYGYSDWRLPNAKELGSIVDFGSAIPAINQSIFPNTPSGPYWSSTPSRANDLQSLFIGFQAGDYGPVDRIDSSIYLRLVRTSADL